MFSENVKAQILSTLLNGTVAAALVAGGFGLWQTILKSEQKKKENQQVADLEVKTQFVKTVLNFDRQRNKNTFSAFRTMHELGLLDKKRWNDHVQNNLSSLPRFYHSAFIWSIFHPKVKDIKHAFHTLKFYQTDPSEEGDKAGVVNPEFVHATLLLQHHRCRWPDPNATQTASSEPQDDPCWSKADGIMGPKSLLYLSLLMKARGHAFDLH
ncbi:MAG: hypothetical protein AAGF86_20680 [Pseudomonadota bacterium]